MMILTTHPKKIPSNNMCNYLQSKIGLSDQAIELASYKFEPPFGYTHGQVLEKAHSLRVKRGANNIEDIDIASAIKCLVWER